MKAKLPKDLIDAIGSSITYATEIRDPRIVYKADQIEMANDVISMNQWQARRIIQLLLPYCTDHLEARRQKERDQHGNSHPINS